MPPQANLASIRVGGIWGGAQFLNDGVHIGSSYEVFYCFVPHLQLGMYLPLSVTPNLVTNRKRTTSPTIPMPALDCYSVLRAFR